MKRDVFVRSAFNYDMDKASDETGIRCDVTEDGEPCPSMTKQAFVEECDINVLVRRFGLTGILPQQLRAPMLGDFENVPSYHEAMNAITEAQQSFMMMPADVRERFGNDPGAFVNFCSDGKNRSEAEKLGLVFPAPAAKVALPADPKAAVAPPAAALDPKAPAKVP